MLNHALKYLSMGLSVIPLCHATSLTACDTLWGAHLKPHKVGKTPKISWECFKTKKATEEEVREWFTKWPNANLGVVTGAISGVCVVDLDGPEGLASAERLGLKYSTASVTGNGKHLWHSLPKDGKLIANSVRSFPGIDIRGEGGFVVVPPSIHESGRRYRWLGKGIGSVEKLPFLPLEKLSMTGLKKEPDSKEEGWIAKALQEMTYGNIDDTLFTVCSRLRHDGYSAADALVLLTPHADRVGATPGHLDEKIENVWTRYEHGADTNSVPGWNCRVGSNEGLIIHSPTNPDSLKQYEHSRLEILQSNGSGTLETGYSKLDTMLQGGLKSSRLFTVAARTGVGKTNWLLGVAREVCRTGKSVLLFSTEMPYSQIWERYIQTLGSPEEFTGHKFYVCDSFAPNLERVEEAIKEIKPDVFMFDHINHVSEEQRELGSFMQGLNFIRRKYECAGIVTAQLNRSADWVDLKTGEKVTPRMSMIKGSGTIEQASSRVLLLSETRVTPEGTEIVGNLDKNDNGPKGLIHFMLQSNPYRMAEL